MELIELLANVDWQDPAAAVAAWVTEDRMLYGTYPFDEAWSREIAVQQVRRAPTSSATASTIPSPSTGPQAGVICCLRFAYRP